MGGANFSSWKRQRQNREEEGGGKANMIALVKVENSKGRVMIKKKPDSLFFLRWTTDFKEGHKKCIFPVTHGALLGAFSTRMQKKNQRGGQP